MTITENTNSKLVWKDWKEIDWKKVSRKVFKTQKRIYKASQRGDVKLVRRLQKMMVKSWYARLLAVRRVTQENKGKKTAGVDGVKSLKPTERIELANTLKLDGKSRPTRRVWIPKPGTKEKRPLGIPTMRDRAKQCLLKMALEPEWEAKFEPNSYGFRPGRSCHDALKAIHLAINKKPKYVLDADIAKCFDRIDHNRLLEKLNTFPTFKRQIKAWLKSGVIDFSKWAERKGYQETSEGTPQGGVCSPLLANIALHGLEKSIEKAFPSNKMGYIKRAKKLYGRMDVSKPILIRYADDFVLLCDELSVVQRCQELISEWLNGMGLELKPNKTKIAHTLVEYNGGKPGFDFLGFTVRQFPRGKHYSGKNTKGKLLGFGTIIKPSQAKIKEHYDSIADWISKMKTKKQAELIGRLNPIIRGWSNYQSPWNSSTALKKLDHLIWKRLWRWATRRHPNKGKKWIARKYWLIDKGGGWKFATKENKNSPKLLNHSEFKTSDKWVKVQGIRSPYDGDEIYWSKRIGQRYKTLEPQKARLLKRQKGKCAHCGLTFKTDDVLEKHHLIPKTSGGKNSDKNLILVHLHCHDQIHR